MEEAKIRKGAPRRRTSARVPEHEMKSPLKEALGASPRHHRAPETQQDQRLVGAPWCLVVRPGVCTNGPNLDHGS
jgi:hypothetical protein